MDNSLISKNDMRRYFEEVFRLSETGEKFPVDFEKVWPLAYQRKHHAVRGLREGGIEGVDYQFFPKYGENTSTDYQAGGRPSKNYRITVACLEWLIARRHRTVFEVYRRVFHQAVRATAFMTGLGLWPMEHEIEINGRKYFPYLLILETACMSTRSGSVVSRRRRRYPSEFVWKDGIWWVSSEFSLIFEHLVQADEYRKEAERRSERMIEEKMMFAGI